MKILLTISFATLIGTASTAEPLAHTAHWPDTPVSFPHANKEGNCVRSKGAIEFSPSSYRVWKRAGHAPICVQDV